jgi:hypothetical protein
MKMGIKMMNMEIIEWVGPRWISAPVKKVIDYVDVGKN